MSKNFKIATKKPTKSDPYIYLYNNSKKGGKSWCITGKPVDSDCNVLSNCVGWACGRFNHIYNLLTGYNGIKYPAFCCNAENFIEVAKKYGLSVGQTPKVGAIMCWQKGNTLGGADGAGHVAIVEKVISSTEVYTSESGYNYKAFYNVTRKKGNGGWGVNSPYKFRAFIYNPAVDNSTNKNNETTETKKKETSSDKKVVETKPAVTNIKPIKNTDDGLKVGDTVMVEYNSPVYGTSIKFDKWVYKTSLYVRNIDHNKITISINKSGAVTGNVDRKYLIKIK